MLVYPRKSCWLILFALRHEGLILSDHIGPNIISIVRHIKFYCYYFAVLCCRMAVLGGRSGCGQLLSTKTLLLGEFRTPRILRC